MDQTVSTAAQALGRAGQWDLAVALLDSLTTQSTAADRDVIRADLVADKAFWTSTPMPDLSGADHHPHPAATSSWAGSWSHARAHYTRLLQDRLALNTVDPPAALELLNQLRGLREAAPDPTAELAVRFHLGLVHENLLGDAAAATPHWTAAAQSPDPDTAASALRHLGGQAADTGDTAHAHDLWWQSFQLRAGAGDIPGALAQLALLTTSATLHEAVTAWIEAAGLAVLQEHDFSRSPTQTMRAE